MRQKSQKVLAAIAVLGVLVAAALFLFLQTQFAVYAQTDHSPVFSNTETGIRRIAENTPTGTDIGDPFTATDEDSHTLTYLILDKLDADSFDIGSTTGTTAHEGASGLRDQAQLFDSHRGSRQRARPRS